jgi:hypothetical protein
LKAGLATIIDVNGEVLNVQTMLTTTATEPTS